MCLEMIIMRVTTKGQVTIPRNIREVLGISPETEIDFVEEKGGKIFGFEFKWKSKSKLKLPKTFVKTYNAETNLIDRNNFREFVIIKYPVHNMRYGAMANFHPIFPRKNSQKIHNCFVNNDSTKYLPLTHIAIRYVALPNRSKHTKKCSKL